MSFRVRYTPAAREDLKRLFSFLLERNRPTALRAREAIGKSVEFLAEFSFSCRKAGPETPFQRELLIPFGASGMSPFSRSRIKRPSPSWRSAIDSRYH